MLDRSARSRQAGAGGVHHRGGRYWQITARAGCRRALAEAGEAVTWLEGRCISFGQSIPFLPFIDQLRENLDQRIRRRAEIISKSSMGCGAWARSAHIPFIRYLLGVDPGDPEVVAMDAAARRKSFRSRPDAHRAARIRPVVLVCEDLHWIDTSSEECLDFPMDSVAGSPSCSS